MSRLNASGLRQAECRLSRVLLIPGILPTVGRSPWTAPNPLVRLVVAQAIAFCRLRLSRGLQAIGFCRLRRAPGYSPSLQTPTTSARGQALIEFALILPLLFLLILNVVNFGAFIYAMITVANAARTGAQYMIMGGAWVGLPVEPDANMIRAVVIKDLSSLPANPLSPTLVKVCWSNSGATPPVVCDPAGTPPGMKDDPESGLYVLGTVDVSYTYRPLIPFWDFPNLGIHLTLPPTAIHRRAVMRMVQ